jgi:hypothetical protein
MTPSDARTNLAHDAEQRRARILAMEAGAELDALEEQRRAILEMPPGDQLNALVAEQVMGWERIEGEPPVRTYWLSTRRHDDGRRIAAGVWQIPRYSTNPGASWSVVEALPGCCTKITRENVAGVRYDVTINLDESHTRTFHARAGTMPLAVCRCALLAALP